MLVVIGPAIPDPLGLSHSDLDVVYGEVVPERLKEGVGKAQGDEVLDGFLAKIMVNSENPVFAEYRSHRLVDGPGALQVMADGLFHDNPAGGGCKARGLERAANLAVETGRDRQIEHRCDGDAHRSLKPICALDCGGVGDHIVEPSFEPTPNLIGQTAHPKGDRLFGFCNEIGPGDLCPGGGDNTNVRVEKTVCVQEVEGRKQHALGEVARPAKQHNDIDQGSDGHGIFPLVTRTLDETPEVKFTIQCRIAKCALHLCRRS